jgi:hypothetical protein
MNPKSVFLILCAAILLAITPLIFYLFYFKTLTISNNPSDWGPFGDFIGGLVNPVLSAFNLGALIYLTYTVSQIEEKRNVTNNSHQKEIFISELRMLALKEFSQCRASFVENMFTSQKLSDYNVRVTIFQSEWSELIRQYTFLFQGCIDDDWISELRSMVERTRQDHNKVISFHETYPNYRFNKLKEQEDQLDVLLEKLKESQLLLQEELSNYLGQLTNFVSVAIGVK